MTGFVNTLTSSAHTVILESLPGAPPVDEATVLWSEEQKSLAKVRPYQFDFLKSRVEVTENVGW